MKVAVSIRVPPEYNKSTLQQIIREIEGVLNGLAEGRISVKYNAVASEPTGGEWAAGDFVPNNAPEELGSGGSKYVVTGWIRSTSDTWLECRSLTGN